MPQKKYQTRLPDDDAERVDEFVENHNISQAEAVRRLIRAGLEVERDDSEPEIYRAAQVGTVISLVVLAVVALIGVLVMSGVL